MKKDTVVRQQTAVSSKQLAVGSKQLAVSSWGLGIGSWGLGVKLFVLVMVFTVHCFSQVGVGINTAGNTAHSSAILDVSSTTKGLLITRMTTTERDNIAVTCSCTPAEGLLIFNTTTKCFEAYVNGVWNTVSCPAACTSPSSPTAGTHLPTATGIVWNWNTVSGATGYKWSTTNDYGGATATTPAGTTSYTQSSLTSCTSYTLYVWAVNACGNSTSLALTATTSYTSPCTSCTMTDKQGKSYPVVVINNQCWMQKNMDDRTTGDCYLSTPSYCDTYGRLYTWDQASGICPSGWHLPSNVEFSAIAPTAGSNGFNNLLGGFIYKNSNCGGYGSWNFGTDGFYWTATYEGYYPSCSCNAHYRFYGSGNLPNGGSDYDCYMESVRCVKN